MHGIVLPVNLCLTKILDARIVRDASLPGSPLTPIFLRGLRCDASIDTSILDCESGDRGITKCTHDQDVVVHCEGTY